jgi:hypothetical protein
MGRPKYTTRKLMPCVYACPVVPTNVMALICVAITDRPAAHHFISRPARKKSEIPFVSRPDPDAEADDPDEVDDEDDPVDRGQYGHREKRAGRPSSSSRFTRTAT